MISTTHKQAELLAYIEQYLRDNQGTAPSFQEMTDAIGLHSKSGIHRLLTALEERGRIVRRKDRARAIQIVADDMFAGVPTHLLIAEIARRGEMNAEARKAA